MDPMGQSLWSQWDSLGDQWDSLWDQWDSQCAANGIVRWTQLESQVDAIG